MIDPEQQRARAEALVARARDANPTSAPVLLVLDMLGIIVGALCAIVAELRELNANRPIAPTAGEPSIVPGEPKSRGPAADEAARSTRRRR